MPRFRKVTSVKMLEKPFVMGTSVFFRIPYDEWMDPNSTMFQGGLDDSNAFMVVYGRVTICYPEDSVVVDEVNTLVFTDGQFYILPYIDLTGAHWNRP